LNSTKIFNFSLRIDFLNFTLKIDFWPILFSSSFRYIHYNLIPVVINLAFEFAVNAFYFWFAACAFKILRFHWYFWRSSLLEILCAKFKVVFGWKSKFVVFLRSYKLQIVWKNATRKKSLISQGKFSRIMRDQGKYLLSRVIFFWTSCSYV
jgi:hypothetical protein